MVGLHTGYGIIQSSFPEESSSVLVSPAILNANKLTGASSRAEHGKTYFSPEALRNANGAVVNKLLALRNPRL
jgi:hypothetical protein